MKYTTALRILALFFFTSCVANPKLSTPTISVLDYVSNPEYNKECKNLNLPKYQGQLDFLGIYPGESTENFVKITVGDPTKVFSSGDEVSWYYDSREEMYFSVIFVSKIVKRINVDNMSKNDPSLFSIIEKYGCPNIIILLNTSEDQVGSNRIVFTYSEIGVEFWYEGIHVGFTSVPREITYFKPTTLAVYVQNLEHFLFFGSSFMEPIDWNEVVISE